MKDFLVMENITKVYDNGVMANDNVCFSAEKGEIHAICGENGAGKSTLMKLLFGVEQPNQGRIIIRGEEVKLTSPLKAIEMGIGMVYQHFVLVPTRKSTKSYALLPKDPMPYAFGNELTGMSIPLL